MLGLLGGGENVCGWLFMMELFTLRVSLHKKMTEAGIQTVEPVVILTACLFSFVDVENEMQSSGTGYRGLLNPGPSGCWLLGLGPSGQVLLGPIFFLLLFICFYLFYYFRSQAYLYVYMFICSF